ncbi:MAG: hypothetical protein JNL85_19230 [Rubrivivax sp.]|nr:hypothetical protein [Rubrivivax sp.]
MNRRWPAPRALLALLAMAAMAATLLAPQAARAQAGLVFNAGLRSGGGFESADGTRQELALRGGAAYSLAFEWPYDDHRAWQVWLSRQGTRLRLGAAAATPGTPGEMPLVLTTLQMGGVNYFDSPGGRRPSGPYVAGGLGLTHLAPDLAGTSARTRWSMSLALGHEWPLAGTVSWRAELRAHLTLLNSEGGFFCSGGCTVFIRGDTLTQVEALVGLRVGF